MKKHLLGLTLMAAMLFMIPASVQASQVETIGVEQDDDTRNDIQITVNKSVVRVVGAEGQVMEVISLTGRHVMSDANGVVSLIIPLAEQDTIYDVSSSAINLVDSQKRGHGGPSDAILFK